MSPPNCAQRSPEGQSFSVTHPMHAPLDGVSLDDVASVVVLPSAPVGPVPESDEPAGPSSIDLD